MSKKLHIDTLCVQAGYNPGKGEPRQVPIIQSTTFKYETSEQMGRLFDLEDSGYFYTRLQNPTTSAYEERIAALYGAVGALAVASGQKSVRLWHGRSVRDVSLCALPTCVPVAAV